MGTKQQINELGIEVAKLRAKIVVLEAEAKFKRSYKYLPPTLTTMTGTIAQTTSTFRGRAIWVGVPSDGSIAATYVEKFDDELARARESVR